MLRNHEDHLVNIAFGVHFEKPCFLLPDLFYKLLNLMSRLGLLEVKHNPFEICCVFEEFTTWLSPKRILVATPNFLLSSVKHQFEKETIFPGIISDDFSLEKARVYSKNSKKILSDFFQNTAAVLEIVSKEMDLEFPQIHFLGLVKKYALPTKFSRIPFFCNDLKKVPNALDREITQKRSFSFSQSNLSGASEASLILTYSSNLLDDKKNQYSAGGLSIDYQIFPIQNPYEFSLEPVLPKLDGLNLELNAIVDRAKIFSWEKA